MTKFQMARPNGPWDYPTLGFVAEADGAILDGSLSSPPITLPPDPFWSVYTGGSAESGITRYGNPTVTPAPETTNGFLLAYSNAANTYVPTGPASVIQSAAWAEALSATIADEAFDPNDLGYDIIVVAGQSNAVGFGEGYDARLDPTHSRIWQLASSGLLIDQVCIAQDPLFHTAQGPAGRVGFTMTLARLFVDRAKLNRRILIVPVAYGGTGFRITANGSWQPTYSGGFLNLYQFAVGQIRKAQQLTIRPGDTHNRIVGFFWHQGESDSNTSTNADAYAAHLDEMIDAFRTDIPELATVPFVVGQMEPSQIPITTFEPTVNAVHIDTPRRKTLTGFAYGPLGYSQIKVGEDSVHYTGAGQRVFAPILFDAWQRAATNVAGTAPAAPASVTVTQTGGTTATATWPQPDGRATGYDVQYQVNGGSWNTATRSSTLIDVTQGLTGLAVTNVVTARVRTVNETGVSAWTTSAPTTLISVPAQVTGLTAGTPTSQAVPLNWATAANATSYTVEYKKTADSTWIPAATGLTVLTATVAGLAAATSYDFRVTGVNGAGSGTPSSTATASTAAPAALSADVGSTPQVAYSVARRTVLGYAGSAFRVRRSSDNTEQDIGFATGTDNVDTTALTTFVGAGDGFVKTLYDQSGNGWDFTQATTTKQPKIVSTGTVVVRNGWPSMLFDGVDDFFLDATSGHLSIIAGAGVCSTAVVAQPQSGKATGTMLWYGEVATAASNTSSHVSLMASVGNAPGGIRPLAVMRDDANSNPLNLTYTANLDDALHTRWTISDGDVVRQDIDLPATAPAAPAQKIRDTVTTVNQRHFGGFGTSLSYKGYLTELVNWASVLTEDQIVAGKTNQKSYYGTP